MSPSQDSRDVVSHATPPPDTKPYFPQFLSARNSTQGILIVIGLDSTHPIRYDLIPKQIGAIRGTLHLFYQRSRWQARSRDEVQKQTLDGSTRGWFERLPRDSINEWAELRDAFAARYSVRRACLKGPHEITKIVRKANESLTAFKERWTVETGFIMGVPEVMKISSFMDSVKSPELAKRFSDKVPTTVNEMMERLDDFVRSEVTYTSIELPKGETGETHRRVSLPFSGRDASPFQNIRLMESRRDDYRGRDGYRTNRERDDRASYPSARGEYNRRVAPVLTLNSLIKYPKEILATETQLRLPAPRPMINPLRSGNTDRY
ncbi:reverse transcriptase domain-containing protein [Tanacetum coccineum]